MKRFINKLKTKPKLYKCLNILGIIFIILNILWYLIMNIALLVGVSNGTYNNEKVNIQNLHNLATTPLRPQVKRSRDTNDTLYLYSGDLNTSFKSSIASQVGATYYHEYQGGSFPSETSLLTSISSWGSNITAYYRNGSSSSTKTMTYFYIYKVVNSPNLQYNNCYEMKFANSNGSQRYVTSNSFYDEVAFSYKNGGSTTLYPLDYLAIPHTNTFYTYAINALNSGGGYTEEDLEQAEQDGYEEGYSAGYDDGVQNYIPPINSSQVVINENYDWRRLFTNNIDSDTGLMYMNVADSQELDFYQYAISGNSNWKVGDKTYNAIVFTIQRLDDAQAVSVNGSNIDYRYISSIIGNSSATLFGMARIDYVYLDNLENESSYQKVGVGINYLSTSDYSLNVYKYDTLFTNFNDSSKPSILPNYQLKWNNYGFRYLNDFNSDSSLVKVPEYETLTLAQLLSLNDTAILNNDSVNSNLFTLLGQGFKAVANVLNINILPNISLGMLVFLPLIVTIVLFIIKMLRK